MLGCAAPPSALPVVIPVPLGWCQQEMSWAGCAKSSDGAQCQLMDELFLTQMSQKATWGEGGCCRAPAVLHEHFCDIWPETAALSFKQKKGIK